MSYSCFDEQPDLILDELDYEETKDGISVDKFILMIITKTLISTLNSSTTTATKSTSTKW